MLSIVSDERWEYSKLKPNAYSFEGVSTRFLRFKDLAQAFLTQLFYVHVLKILTHLQGAVIYMPALQAH